MGKKDRMGKRGIHRIEDDESPFFPAVVTGISARAHGGCADRRRISEGNA
jgi:hypothetical protein